MISRTLDAAVSPRITAFVRPPRRPRGRQHALWPDDPSRPCRDSRAERFAILLVAGQHTQADAFRMTHPTARHWKRATVDSRASELARKMQGRIDHLKDEAARQVVIGATEAQAILSEIARADPADYLNAGPDGIRIAFGPASKNRRAVAGIKSRNVTTGQGSGERNTAITEIRLRDPIAAIEELAKLRGWHQPERLEIMGARGGPVQIQWQLEVVDRNACLGRRAQQQDALADAPQPAALPEHQPQEGAHEQPESTNPSVA